MAVMIKRVQGMGEPHPTPSATRTTERATFATSSVIKIVHSSSERHSRPEASSSRSRATRSTVSIHTARTRTIFDAGFTKPIKVVGHSVTAVPNPKTGKTATRESEPSSVSTRRPRPTSTSTESTSSKPIRTHVKVVGTGTSKTGAEATTTPGRRTRTSVAIQRTSSSHSGGYRVNSDAEATTIRAPFSTERLFGASATKVAAVVSTTSTASVSSAVTKPAVQATHPGEPHTSSFAVPTTSVKVFNGGSSTKLAAVNTQPSQAAFGAPSASAQVSLSSVPSPAASPSFASVVSGSPNYSSGSIAAGSSGITSSAASATGHNSVVGSSNTAIGSAASSPSSSPDAGTGSKSSAIASQGGGAGFFHSLPRSTSIGLSAVLILAILALLFGLCGCLIMRRRRRRSRGFKLGSEDGSPREKWNEKNVGARELSNEEAGNPFRDDAAVQDEIDDEDLQPEAMWRRRLNRLNNSAGWVAQGPRQDIDAPSTIQSGPMSERRQSASTWTSFDGVGMFDTESELCGPIDRSRQLSKDMSISGYSFADSGSSMSLADAPLQRLGRLPNLQFGGQAQPRHPLATSYVPVTPSQYSSHSSRDNTPLASPTAQQPRTPTTPTAHLLPDLVTLGSNSPPIPASSLRPPLQPGSWRFSLDKIMGAASEFMNVQRRGSTGSVQSDKYTAFMTPRRAPPTPKMDGLSRSHTIPPRVAPTMGMYSDVNQTSRPLIEREDTDESTLLGDQVRVLRASHLGSAKGVRTSLANVTDEASIHSRTGLGLPESIVPRDPAGSNHGPMPPVARILITSPSPDMPSRPYGGFAPIDDPEDVSPTSSPRVGSSPKVYSPTTPDSTQNPFAAHNSSIDEPSSPPRDRSNAIVPSTSQKLFGLVSPFAPRASVPPSPIVEEDETNASPVSINRSRLEEFSNQQDFELADDPSSSSDESHATTIRAPRASAPSKAFVALDKKRRHSLNQELKGAVRRGSTSSLNSIKTLRPSGAPNEPISTLFTMRRASTGGAAAGIIEKGRRSSSTDTFGRGSNLAAYAATRDDGETGSSDGSDEGSDEAKMTTEQKQKRFEEMERTRRLMVERRRRSDGEVIPRF